MTIENLKIGCTVSKDQVDQLEPGRGVCNPVVPECGMICGELIEEVGE